MQLILPDRIQKIITKMKSAGYECFVVGGSVRGLIMGAKVDDWDFTTNATPEQIQKVFPDSFYENKFGTVGLKFKSQSSKVKITTQNSKVSDEDNEKFEITTYRTEAGYKDKRHPDKVGWGKNIEEDLARRDLTINAIAFDGGKFVDPYNGREDIKKKLIRCVGKPEDRFDEDSLRMLRAVRIAAELGFMIDDSVFQAIKKNAQAIKFVSGERIREEIRKMLISDNAADGMLILHNTGLLNYLIPEIEKGYGVKQAGHHTFDVFKHSLESLRECPSKDWLVRLATFLHDIGKPEVVRFINDKPTFYNHEVVGANLAKALAFRWHLTKEEREKLYTLVRWHMFSVSEFLTDAAVRRFINRIGKDKINSMMELRIGDRLGGGLSDGDILETEKASGADY